MRTDGTEAFDQALRQAELGALRSGKVVVSGPDLGVDLTGEQLERLAQAADLAEAKGAQTAAVLIDGMVVRLDVASRGGPARRAIAGRGRAGTWTWWSRPIRPIRPGKRHRALPARGRRPMPCCGGWRQCPRSAGVRIGARLERESAARCGVGRGTASMASTTALFASLSGLNTETRRLDVIGNNIANVNTTAFKASRLHQANQNPRTFSLGTEPTNQLGGTNPMQVGTGTRVAAIERSMASGTISPTGNPTDVAIDGAGFFVLRGGEERYYTRAGAFTINENNELVTVDGHRVQGWAVNESFQIQRGPLVDLSIPLGSLTIAQATTQVRFDGGAGRRRAGGPAGLAHGVDRIGRAGGLWPSAGCRWACRPRW
ncbi:MAG: hypothetical protein KatS3mg103_0192 [Phycisphaerales bacterium]|nr:MAG: hypothetical protein KatS3mg103_0192 [Phycisphaerales bacterium]